MPTAASDQVRVFTVAPDDDGIRLDRWFKRNLPDASFNLVSRWSRTGQLRVDGKRAAPGDRIEAGQVIRVPPAEAPVATKPTRPERRTLSEDEIAYVNEMVIHRDPAAIVVNKPPGLATQGGTKTNVHLDGLLDGLADEHGERPKLVHRLDKDTSGVLLLARTARAAAFFSKSFSGRTARKVYWALVVDVPEIKDGFIDLPIAKQPGTGGEKMHVDTEEGLPARTRYRLIERAGNRAAWVELQPLTGRTHQLRVHMAAIGHPIVGDGKYGGQDAFLTGAISRKLHLHARRLRIDHPDGGRIDVTAELPTHFAESLAGLGFDQSAGDLPLDEVKFSETAEGKRRAATAAAKSRRKERKGERRSRGEGLMHVNRAFAWNDQAELLAFVDEISFAHLFVPSPEGPLVAQVPMVVTPDGNLRFHLARANPPAKYLDGAVALASFAGPDAYISPDWYASADQVPTWNYVTAEARGQVRRLSEADLIGNLDALSIAHETRLLPKKPWTRGKMRRELFDGMLKAIVGFEMEVETLRGTRKLGQNKQVADIEGAAAGLEAAGKTDVAALMRSARA